MQDLPMFSIALFSTFSLYISMSPFSPELLICLGYVVVHRRHVCVLALKQLIGSGVLEHLCHRSQVTTLVYVKLPSC